MCDTLNKLRKLLHKIAEEQNIQDYQLEVNPLSTGGANYSSKIYAATISSKNKNLDLFIKEAAIGAKLREKLNIKVFDTEIFVYSELKTAYKALEEKHKVLERQRLYLPEYYGANPTVPDEIIVLENLASKGFTTHNRMKSIDWEYAATAVTELVKLHALSMAYKREYPEKFKYAEQFMIDWLNEDLLDGFWRTGFQATLKVIREENREKMKKFLDTIDLALANKMYAPLTCEVILHGDYRPSNLMHRRKDDGSLEIIAVDHQTMQVGCPVTDLLYLIFTGTDKQFRDQFFDKLIDHYYSELSQAMLRLGIDPETTYSREDFDFELKEKLPFGLAVAAFTLPIVTVNSEDAPEMNDMDLTSFALQKTSALFPDRINGVVDDYVRWGILKD